MGRAWRSPLRNSHASSSCWQPRQSRRKRWVEVTRLFSTLPLRRQVATRKRRLPASEAGLGHERIPPPWCRWVRHTRMEFIKHEDPVLASPAGNPDSAVGKTLASRVDGPLATIVVSAASGQAPLPAPNPQSWAPEAWASRQALFPIQRPPSCAPKLTRLRLGENTSSSPAGVAPDTAEG